MPMKYLQNWIRMQVKTELNSQENSTALSSIAQLMHAKGIEQKVIELAKVYHQKWLALDFGTQKIGVAEGNLITQSTQALHVAHFETRNRRFELLNCLFETYKPTILVLGLPMTIEGFAQTTTLQAVNFGLDLWRYFNHAQTKNIACLKQIIWVDERYSSCFVEDKAIKDAYSAQIILERCFKQITLNQEIMQINESLNNTDNVDKKIINFWQIS